MVKKKPKYYKSKRKTASKAQNIEGLSMKQRVTLILERVLLPIITPIIGAFIGQKYLYSDNISVALIFEDFL